MRRPDAVSIRSLGGIADLLAQSASIAPAMRTGVEKVDSALPWGGLPRGVHEIAMPSTDVAGVGFAAFLLAARSGPVLWCRSRRMAAESGRLYGGGLARFGLAPERLVLVEANKPADLLWAMEEGLRAGKYASVAGEGAMPDLTASRRLQLAAEAGDGVVLLLSEISAVAPTGRDSALACMTRWRAASIPTEPEAGGPGRPRWELELRRCRGGGRPQSWIVEWDDATLSLSLVSPLADRSLAAAAV